MVSDKTYMNQGRDTYQDISSNYESLISLLLVDQISQPICRERAKQRGNFPRGFTAQLGSQLLTIVAYSMDNVQLSCVHNHSVCSFPPLSSDSIHLLLGKGAECSFLIQKDGLGSNPSSATFQLRVLGKSLKLVRLQIPCWSKSHSNCTLLMH